jgi:hypothetical protein
MRHAIGTTQRVRFAEIKLSNTLAKSFDLNALRR